MKKALKKFRLLFVLALVLQLVAIPSLSFAAETDTETPTWVTPVNYLALGDSLATGVTPDSKLGSGYTDFIAEALKSKDVLNSFNKGFTLPGYTTSDILKDLQANVTKPVFGIGNEGDTAELHKSIAAADIITISAGANDILPYFKVDATTGVPTVDLAKIMASIQQVGVNYSQMLKAIYKLNPDVQVYVMGYYNPFPQMDEKYQTQIAQLMNGLNGAIQTGMTGTTAAFIPTAEKIAENYAANLPNPKNIHLSEAGYKVVSDLFNQKLVESYPWVSKDTLSIVVSNKTNATLSWKPATDNTGVAGYAIYNGKELVGQVTGNILTYEIGNLEENKAYTFTVVALDASGNASTVNPTAAITTGVTPVIFPDIQQHWAKDYITQAVAAGVVKGYPDGTFKPEHKITRAQAASIIVNALKLKTDKAAPFEDIGIYAAETQAEIAAAYQYGIIKGSDGKFRPTEYVTRAQLALMLKRTVESVTGNPYTTEIPAPFSDIDHYDDETKAAISMLATFKIISGSDGKFMPENTAKRGQAAKILINSLTYIK
ncbi:S-layer homology domain-containing protein [Psychrobacillus sp. INOP01]|uniref:S-layer homology domain-containing protein n=1 Tax=Psychrobacillus sp. INOP01 TaxID=2829187 RepID=UPI001BAC44F8|nr:S-layer homology domain-containing protein [Psychrobacillus sp. INOP01]QUG40568.1 S-layer homology domain-containing protein [Psychrobacillus sp. INOP01]